MSTHLGGSFDCDFTHNGYNNEIIGIVTPRQIYTIGFA